MLSEKLKAQDSAHRVPPILTKLHTIFLLASYYLHTTCLLTSLLLTQRLPIMRIN
jgi:hypothetical protein